MSDQILNLDNWKLQSVDYKIEAAKQNSDDQEVSKNTQLWQNAAGIISPIAI